MKKFNSLCAIILCISLMAGNAFAVVPMWRGVDASGVGNWSDGSSWWRGTKPDGIQNVNISGALSQCTLNTDEGGWELSDRTLVIVSGAKLIIASGGVVKPAQMQITGAGRVEQTGGIVSIYKDKLYVGGYTGGCSTYTISGGTLTASDLADNDGYLNIGLNGGEGKFTVEGKGSTILMRKLYIGATDTGETPGTGTLEFKIGSSGVTPIQMTDNIYIDGAGANSTANLLVSLTAAPPIGDILLAENMGGGTTAGIFDTVNGIAAPEGASVVLNFGGVDYSYTLTYSGIGSGDTNANDVMLLYVPEPATLALLSLGLIAIRRKK